MRLMLALAAWAALAASAQAQDTANAPVATAAPVPPSACPAFTAVPAAPDGATATADQIRAAVAAFEAWRTTTQATMDCRTGEVRALAAQTAARRSEYLAAQTEHEAGVAAFQAQLDAFNARTGRRQR